MDQRRAIKHIFRLAVDSIDNLKKFNRWVSFLKKKILFLYFQREEREGEREGVKH